MANGITTSPNMGLQIPSTGVTPGPEWMQAIVQSLNIIDQHNHSGAPSEGVQISSNGIVLNEDLDFAGFGATTVSLVQFTPEASALLNTLYVDGVDLYYNDGNGNTVRITTGGVVNATSSGISSGTATASFVGSVLVVNAASNTPANIRGASILIGNNVAASHYITLSPPNSLAASYQVFWPAALPGAVMSLLTIDTGGNMANGVVDNSTLQLSALTLSVKAGGISATELASNAVTTAKVLDANITRPKLVAVGQQISSSCGNFTTTNDSPVDVTPLTVTITTTGRPVVIGLIPDGSGSISKLGATGSFAFLYLLRGASTLVQIGTATTTLTPLPGVLLVDPVAAGTYTYKVRLSTSIATSTTATCAFAKLYAYEL